MAKATVTVFDNHAEMWKDEPLIVDGNDLIPVREDRGYIESRIDHNPSLLEEFKRKDYYGSEWLKFFCEHYECPTERSAEGRGSNLDLYSGPMLIIRDPDGYINMRSGVG